jgi:hypothetical protein
LPAVTASQPAKAVTAQRLPMYGRVSFLELAIAPGVPDQARRFAARQEAIARRISFWPRR